MSDKEQHMKWKSLTERLRINHFWFWREIGGSLPKSPPEPLQFSGLWHLVQYIRYVWLAAICLVITIFLSSFLAVVPAFIIKKIVNNDIKKHTIGPLMSDITHLILIYIAITIINAMSGWFASWSNTRIVWRMRGDVVGRQLDIPFHTFLGRGTEQTVVRAINEVGVPGGDSTVFSGVAGILNVLTSAISYIVTIVSTVTAMLILNIDLTLWSFILFPIAIVLAVWWGRLTYGATHRQYESLTKLTSFLLRHTTKRQVLLDKFLGHRTQVLHQFRAQNQVLTNASILERILPNWYNNLFQIVQGATVGVIWLIGGHHVFSGTLSLGVIVAMIGLITQLNTPVTALAEIWFSLRNLTAVAERVSRDLEKGKSDVKKHQRSSVSALSPVYRLKDVTLIDTHGEILAPNLSLCLTSGDVLTVLDAQVAEHSPWSWAAALAGWQPTKRGEFEIGGKDISTIDEDLHRATISIISSNIPVTDITPRELWLTSCPTSNEHIWRHEWARFAGNRIPFPDPDIRLDYKRTDKISRFLINLVAAKIHGSSVWIVVSEPEELAFQWADFDCVVIRVSPGDGRLLEGTYYLVRNIDGSINISTLNSEQINIPIQIPSATTQPVDDIAGYASSLTVVEGDGTGWWASLGIRRHSISGTGRFYKPFSWLFRYIRRYWIYWLIILLFGEVIASVLQTITPLFSKAIIDLGIGKHNMGVVNRNAVLLILFGVIQGISNACFVTLFIQTAGKRMCGEIRDDFFSNILNAPVNFFENNSSSEICSRGINDINAIFNGTDQLIKVLTWQILPNIPGMILLWTLGGARYGFLTLAVDVPFVVLTIWIARLNFRLQQRLFQVVSALFAELRQMASLPRALLIRAFSLEQNQAFILSELNRLIYKLTLVQSLRNTWYLTISTLEGNLLTTAFWAVGGIAIIHGSLTVGILTAIMTYAQLYIGLGGGVSSYVTIYGTLANVERVSSYAQYSPDLTLSATK